MTGRNNTSVRVLRRINRRDFLKISGASLAGAALLGTAACGGGEETANGRIPLILWHQEQPPNRVEQFQKVIDAFNGSQGRFQVTQQVQNYEDVYQKTTSAIQAGEPPDIHFVIPDLTVAIKQTGAVQPVDGIVGEIDSSHGFLRAAVQPYEYEGHTWAIPVFGMIQMLWYRKDMFEDAGLDPESPPQSWDELRQYSERLTQGDRYGVGITSSKHLYTDQEFYTFMITNGGKELFAEDGSVAFDTPENVETMAFYRDLSEFSPPGSNSWTWAEPQAALNNGSLAMAIEKGQFLGPFEEESGTPAENLGVAPVPVAPDGERGSIYYSNAAVTYTQEEEKLEGVGEFMKFVLEPKNYANVLLAEPGLFLPVTDDGDSAAWKDSEILGKYPEAVDLMVEQSKYGYLFGFTHSEIPQGIGQISAENLLSQAVQRAIVDGDSPEAAVAFGQREMEAAAS